MDWVLEEVECNIRGRIHTLEGCIKYHEMKMNEYQDVFNTFDKFESKYHEYHRTYKVALQDEIKWLKYKLQEIEDMKKEEDLRENKKRAYCE